MSSWQGFYVSGVDASKVTIIQQEFPLINVNQGQDFLGLTRPDQAMQPPIGRLMALSADFNTDVIWLSFQSVVDVFEFYHWRRGVVLRVLVFGCYGEERVWDYVAGEPEPWERAVFFDPNVLNDLLDLAETNRAKNRLQKIWHGETILAGGLDPSLDARQSAQATVNY